MAIPMFRQLFPNLTVIASNIANAEVTQGPDGGPYQRQVAILEVDPALVEGEAGVGRGGSG